MKKIIPDMVFQEETNECGLSCIAMLAQTQNIPCSLPALREIFPASDHGTSLSDLSVILQQVGIATAPVLFDHDELHALPFLPFCTMAPATMSCWPGAKGITFA